MVDPVEWIRLVKAEAKELRAIGVLAIGVDGCTATFSEPLVSYATGDKGDELAAAPDVINDALHDPASYVGGVVPGFHITRLVPDED